MVKYMPWKRYNDSVAVPISPIKGASFKAIVQTFSSDVDIVALPHNRCSGLPLIVDCQATLDHAISVGRPIFIVTPLTH